MVKKVIRRTGWSFRGRPFSAKEYASSYLKENTKMSYSKYLTEYARMYKNPKLRRTL